MKLTRIKDKKPGYGQRVLIQIHRKAIVEEASLKLFPNDEVYWMCAARNFCLVKDSHCWCELPEWPEEENNGK